MNRWWRIFSLVGICFILDRISKWLAWHLLSPDGFFVIPGKLGLTLERNQGIAYSIPLPPTLLVLVVCAIIIVLMALLIRAYRQHESAVVLCYSSIIIGAFSNMLDRWRYGYVVDMVVLTGWPVFNLSDVFIAAGAVGLIIILWKSRPTSNLTA